MRPDDYVPGAASGAHVEDGGERRTLVLVRELRHPPATVWKALTDPEHLRRWAPYDADRDLGAVGTATLTTVGAPTPQVSESRVTRADEPHLLELDWGGQRVRWELEPAAGGGTRLTLRHDIDRRFVAMGAAGWHVCLDVLGRQLDGRPVERLVGAEALRHEGWRRLHAEYAQQFGLEAPGGAPGSVNA